MAKIYGTHFDFKLGTIRKGLRDEGRVVPLRDDVLAEASQLSPGAMWGKRPVFKTESWIQNRLRQIARQAGQEGLTVTRLANTHDLHLLRAALPKDVDLETHRSALEGIPRIT